MRIHVEFTFFEWLTLYFRPHGGTVESSTHPRPVPGSRRRSCEVSTLHLENCANARRIHVFWVINPLFVTPRGYGRIVNPFTTCPGESSTFLVKFQLFKLKTVRMHVEFAFFEWLSLYFWPFGGTVESSTPPRPAPESPWPVWEVWTSYLENCANALRQKDRQTDRQRQRQRQTILFIDIDNCRTCVYLKRTKLKYREMQK